MAKRANAYLMAHGAIVRSVAAYGLSECLRMTVGTAAENDRLLAALTDFLAQDS